MQFIDKLMAGETFMDASECMRSGFATSITASSPRALKSFQDMVRGNSLFRDCIVAKLGSQTTATARWRGAVNASMAGGLGRTQAVIAVDKTHPGLRLKMIDEANAR